MHSSLKRCFHFQKFQQISKQEIFNVSVLLSSFNYFYLKQADCYAAFFYFSALKKVCFYIKTKYALKSYLGIFVTNFSCHTYALLKLSHNTIKVFDTLGLSFFTSSAKTQKALVLNAFLADSEDLSIVQCSGFVSPVFSVESIGKHIAYRNCL